jgi:hypothetical protein
MKHLNLVLILGVLSLTGCASSPQEICSDPAVWGQYQDHDHCEQAVAAQQEQSRERRVAVAQAFARAFQNNPFPTTPMQFNQVNTANTITPLPAPVQMNQSTQKTCYSQRIGYNVMTTCN